MAKQTTATDDQAEKDAQVRFNDEELIQIISDYYLRRYKQTQIDLKHPGGRPAAALLQELIYECGQVRMFMHPGSFICRAESAPSGQLRFLGYAGAGIDNAIAQCFAKFAKQWKHYSER